LGGGGTKVQLPVTHRLGLGKPQREKTKVAEGDPSPNSYNKKSEYWELGMGGCAVRGFTCNMGLGVARTKKKKGGSKAMWAFHKRWYDGSVGTVGPL